MTSNSTFKIPEPTLFQTKFQPLAKGLTFSCSPVRCVKRVGMVSLRVSKMLLIYNGLKVTTLLSRLSRHTYAHVCACVRTYMCICACRGCHGCHIINNTLFSYRYIKRKMTLLCHSCHAVCFNILKNNKILRFYYGG